MARGRRATNIFNMSFLDIMACGFGAVTLLFLILRHDPSTTQADPDLRAEVALLEEDIRQGEAEKVTLLNSLARLDERIVEAQGLSSRVLRQIEDRKEELSIQADPEDDIALLRKQVKEMETETAKLQEAGRGKDLRQFAGDGDRQYLTGLKLGGRRILLLVDASASMLAEDIVNVIRRRNMSDAVKRGSPKWRRATRTAEWLVARLPPGSQFQIVVFNTGAKPALAGSEGQWLDTSDDSAVNGAIQGLKATVPQGGTSLINAFAALNSFADKPDNIFLITDGLPTQGASTPSKNTVSARERVELFNAAVRTLPRASVNVILFPMEGDPAAAALYWQLGLASGGSFMSPSTDWP